MPSSNNIFRSIILIARPAAGKSEIIDYWKHSDSEERRQRFHIGDFVEIDDFPMLWTWFEEDDILTGMGKPRHHTDPQGYFKEQYLWDVLIKRIDLEYTKKRRDLSDRAGETTVLIEFSRGKEHGGFRGAFANLSPEILQETAILYIDVSWEESLRKNRKRFNPLKADSILEHGLSDEKLDRLYRQSDWEEIRSENPTFITIQGIQIPYVVFENEDDVTTARGEKLGQRLEEKLQKLWSLYHQK
jgi:hypothetical protein